MLPAEEPVPHQHPASRYQVALSVFSIICFPLGVPYGIAGCGWSIGILFLLYSALITYLNSTLLGRLAMRHDNLHTYSSIAAASFGPRFGDFVGFMQTIGVYLTVIYFLVTLGEYLSILLSEQDLCQRTALVLIAVVVSALGQFPTWAELSWLAFAFFIVTCVTVAVLTYQSLASHYCHPEKTEYTITGVINGLTGICFAFAGSALFPELIQEMQHKADFLGPRGSLALAYYFIVPVYLLAGIMGYWAYGAASSANILENWTAGPVRGFTLAMNLLMFTIGAVQYNQLLCKKLETALGLTNDMGDGMSLIASVDCELNEALSTAKEMEAATQPHSLLGGDDGWTWKRGLVRLSLVMSELFFCEMLFASRIGDIQSLVGAVAGLLTTYILPTVFYSALEPEDRSNMVRFLQMNAVGATVLAVAGSVVALLTIIHHASEYSFFTGPCQSTIGDDDALDSHRCGV